MVRSRYGGESRILVDADTILEAAGRVRERRPDNDGFVIREAAD